MQHLNETSTAPAGRPYHHGSPGLAHIPTASSGAKAAADTAMTERRLDEKMDPLLALRRQLKKLKRLEDRRTATASCNTCTLIAYLCAGRLRRCGSLIFPASWPTPSARSGTSSNSL
jgi:hypothetical protein